MASGNEKATPVFVLGLLGIVICPICGIVAWIMGHGARKQAKEAGEEPTGTLTAGWILGIISTSLFALGIVIWLLIFMLAIGGAAAAAAAGAGAG